MRRLNPSCKKKHRVTLQFFTSKLEPLSPFDYMDLRLETAQAVPLQFHVQASCSSKNRPVVQNAPSFCDLTEQVHAGFNTFYLSMIDALSETFVNQPFYAVVSLMMERSMKSVRIPFSLCAHSSFFLFVCLHPHHVFVLPMV